MKKIALFVLLSVVSLTTFAKQSTFSVYELTCDHESEPIGLDNLEPRFSWKINSVEPDFTQSAYQILVADSKVNLEKGNVWNSGKLKTTQSVLNKFAGTKLQSGSEYFWKVRIWNTKGNVSEWSQPKRFVMGLLSPNDWGKAQWIALENDILEKYLFPGLTDGDKKKWMAEHKTDEYKLPQFRKGFKLQKEIKRAIVYASGLGHFDMFLNGTKVGNHFLDPGWTMYTKSALYVSFDVTNQLKSGNNTLGLMLGNGFYNVPRERYVKILLSFGAPKMKLNLRITYADNSTEEIVSDGSWKASESPITFSSIYGGEDYDANNEIAGWKLNGFDAGNWNNALVVKSPVTLSSQRSYPLIVRNELAPVKIYQNSVGDWMYDFGQNFSGIVRLKVRSNGKNYIRLHPAELLKSDGKASQGRTGSPYWFGYTTKGSAESETWQPQFSYYGYRYIQLEGAVPAGQANPDSLPVIEELVGLHTSADAPEVGSFSCSKPMFNKVHELIDWAIRSNMASVLTDCPHREKLGWIEQNHLMQYSLQYRYDLSRLYEKALQDMSDSQTEKGIIPTIAPEYTRFGWGFDDSPEWGSAFIISPWYIYQWYNDTKMIQKYYPEMQRYVDYLGTRDSSCIVAYGLGDWYDIGPKNPGYSQLTSKGVTSTAMYFYNASILSRMAEILGKKEDVEKYKLLSENIRKAFNKEFYNAETKTYDRNSQTANAIALYFNLVEPENKQQTLKNLIDDIRSRNNGLTAGDVGYRYVLRALEENGVEDVIYDMNSRYDVPGYGYQLAMGATALTEGWTTFGSNNHLMLGHLMEWFYSGLGGIRQQEGKVGFNSILIDPQIVGDITSASTSYESPYGRISCDWKLEGKSYSMKVDIPANTSAIICIPESNSISNFGIPVSSIKNMEILGIENGKTRIKVGSGKYYFNVNL